MGKVYVVGTCDTKGAELGYAAETVRRAGADSVLVDVGTTDAPRVVPPDVSAAEVAGHHPDGPGAVLGLTDAIRSGWTVAPNRQRVEASQQEPRN